jgi:2-iminobutanoate/2-iminopropanoate deaminase
VESQTEQCLKNVEAILTAAGSSLQHVLRCGVFLIDISEFQRMNVAVQ